jgi:UPF0755 protein
MELTDHEQTSSKKAGPIRVFGFLIFSFGTLFVIAAVGIWWLNEPPRTVQYPQSFTVTPGEGARAISADLATRNIVRSETLLNLILAGFFDPTTIKASTYVIESPMTTFDIASKLIEGDFGNDLVRFTHIEGESVDKLAVAAAELPNINQDVFIALARPYEGRLFPDTYFIRDDFTEQELVNLLVQSFNEAIAPLEAAINASAYELDEILILASIIEREANSEESMRLVASVFQNRIEIGMPLQADASIEYILDKPLSELTPVDLDIDSPYNTYINPGLPPTPIGNPGLQAITAVLEPIPSDYFYYLTDESGVFHYAETYDQHLRNIDRYLR